MKILVFGGTGFVGLNIAAALLARGHAVTLFDRAGLPPAAAKEFASQDRLTVIQGDIRDQQAVEQVIAAGYDTIILGAAITAGPEREATDPETILQVNLLAQMPILIAARRAGVRRVINLSSAAAYGASAFRHALLDEETACDPVSLYAITKFASEKVAARLAELWQSDIISVRLSGVFGPWERGNGVRDTPSPQAQMIAALQTGSAAILSRPGVRDWIYALDVAEAVSIVDRGGTAPASALQYFDRRGVAGAAMGAATGRAASGLRLPAGGVGRNADDRSAQRPTARRCRSRAWSRNSAGGRGSAVPIQPPI